MEEDSEITTTIVTLLSEVHVKNIRVAIETDGSSWHIARQLEKQEYTEQCTNNSHSCFEDVHADGAYETTP